MKLTRRRVWLTALIFMIVAVVSLFIFIVFDGDRITQANVDRIQDGMALEQVCDILGQPIGNVPIRPVELKAYQWEGSNGFAIVAFGLDGVHGKKYIPKNWWSRVKGFFGL